MSAETLERRALAGAKMPKITLSNVRHVGGGEAYFKIMVNGVEVGEARRSHDGETWGLGEFSVTELCSYSLAEAGFPDAYMETTDFGRDARSAKREVREAMKRVLLEGEHS